MPPVVSIVIPTYNHGQFIGATIESALEQTYHDFEIIIVDNASTDQSWEVISGFRDARISAYRNDSNIGPVRNWQLGISRAQGRYIKILWSDDLMHPQFLEKTVPILECDPDVGFVIVRDSEFTTDLNHLVAHPRMARTGRYPSNTYIEAAMFGQNAPFSPAATLLRAESGRNLVIDIPNKIGSDFAMHAIGNDLLLLLDAADRWPFIYYIEDPLVYFRAHPGSISTAAGNEKLALHYYFAKAHFAESKRPDLLPRLHSLITLFLIGSKKKSDYGLQIIFRARFLNWIFPNW